MGTIDDLSDKLSEYLSADKVNRVRRAYFYAEQAHEGQRRASGEPYVTHPLAVAFILAELRLDYQSLMAAMLHDVIEDTPIPKEAIREQFGDAVAELVDGVSKLTHLEFQSKQEELAENFQKMVLAMSKDIRVILVKLADRLHNMRTTGSLRPEKKRRKAKETLDIYSPIAYKLGIHSIYTELEDLSFKAMHPLREQGLHAAIKRHHSMRQGFVDKTRLKIQEELENAGMRVRVLGRRKHMLSIYRKMKVDHRSFKDVADILAFRVIVRSQDECYRALGIIHSMYKPVFERFKDYIAVPKGNGYQSIHTTVHSAEIATMEIQIRTEEMDEVANYGIAAHWHYKRPDSSNPTPAQSRAQRWVSQLLEIQQSTGSSLEFIENVKIDLFPDEIYVFSPKGDIYTLPSGSTPVDFAFSVHSEIGINCVGCTVNRKIAALSQSLQSGDVIKINTHKDARPNPNWLKFVVTAKARSTIQHYIKNRTHADAIRLGREMIEKILEPFDLHIDSISGEEWQATAKNAGFGDPSDMFAAVGLGQRQAHSIANLIMASAKESSGGSPLRLKKGEGLSLKYASCCRPIPGDNIIGIAHKTKGILVHEQQCREVRRYMNKPDRIVHLQWDTSPDERFLAAIRVGTDNSSGMLASLAQAVAHMDSNIEAINMAEHAEQYVEVEMVLKVKNRQHLANIFRRLRRLPGVGSIHRK